METQTAHSLLVLAEQAGAGLDGLDRKSLFEQLEQSHGDLLAALQWFLERGSSDEAIRLATALAPFWTASGRLEEGAGWLARVLAAPGGDDAARGRACFEARLIEFWRGSDERSGELHRQALELGRRSRDTTVTAQALTGLARVALRTDQVGEARRLCEEALALSTGSDDVLGRVSALHVLGVAAQMAGQLDQARGFIAERMALGRQLGQYGGIAAEAANLAMVEQQLGNIDAAERLAREALEIARRREDEWMFPYLFSRLAAVAAARRQLERAATLIGAAEAMMRRQGAAWPPDERPHYEQTLAILTEAMPTHDLEQARSRGERLQAGDAVELALAPTQKGTSRPSPSG